MDFKTSGWVTKLLLLIFVPLVLFIIIYTYYNMYKIMTAKCRYCGKKLESRFKKAIIFGFTP